MYVQKYKHYTSNGRNRFAVRESAIFGDGRAGLSHHDLRSYFSRWAISIWV